MFVQSDGELVVVGQDQEFGVPFVFVVKDPLQPLPGILGRIGMDFHGVGFTFGVEPKLPAVFR